MDRPPRKQWDRTSRVPDTVCRYFQDGRCTYGSSCKFLHITDDRRAPDHSRTRLQIATSRYHNELGQDGLREWKHLLNRAPDRRTCCQFFRLAYQLINGDVGAAQETISNFSQNDGLGFVRYLIERQIPEANSDNAKRDIWLTEVRPFLQFITHPVVLDSAVFETEVAKIYNFTQGIGGRRMKLLYDFVMDIPDVYMPSSNPISDHSLDNIEVCLQALAKMIDCNTSNIINTHFKSVFDGLSDLLDNIHNSSDDSLNCRAQKHLQYIQRCLEVGQSLPGQMKRQASAVRAEFILQRDLPGFMSADGPRHDNDHIEITDINIMPTYQEIISLRSEYLPTNDPSLFHLPRIHERLDREFRLLREDNIRQLRDAVHAQLDIMQKNDGSLLRSKRNSLKNYVYDDAAVEDISFDKTRGMNLLVRIHQAASGRNPQKRGDWWAHSKILQAGAFVCMVSEKGSILFCVVADETIISSSQEIKKTNIALGFQSMTKQGKRPSLADDGISSYLYLHLAEAKKDNMLQSLYWYRDVGSFEKLCVVEFPGVLLPSFKHTLESLQLMSRQLDLPFTEFIAPSQNGQGTHVGPPLYTTRRGFEFDLTCLTNDDTKLQHSPRKPLDPQELESHSTLDATQSCALLDSLSRCLALVQGPPGTGKSYTGEKIIKVLLANKEAAGLGPIICVCYTNHALDQLLEHLLDTGVKQIVRIGSQSKSERLKKVNIRKVVQKSERTKAEKKALWMFETVPYAITPLV